MVVMNVSRHRVTLKFAVVGLALGLVVAGCSKDDKSGDSSTSSSTGSATSAAAEATSSVTSDAPASDAADQPGYASLLMKPEDIPAPPDGPFIGEAPKVNTSEPPDVEQNYKSGPNTINSSILIAADPAAAAKALADVAGKVTSTITGSSTPMPSVAPDATVVAGTSTDQTKAMTALLFTEENTAVVILFDSAPGDLNPVPTDYVESVGKVQQAAIQQALPDLG
ncbi:hypothetical protein BH09ACT8_BH09ACT8_66420 [soil metagenome]